MIPTMEDAEDMALIFIWLEELSKSFAWSEASARGAAEIIPMLEDMEDMAKYVSWTEEAVPKENSMLEVAEDKLRDPAVDRGEI